MIVIWAIDSKAAAHAVARQRTATSDGVHDRLLAIQQATIELARAVGAPNGILLPIWRPRRLLEKEDAASRVENVPEFGAFARAERKRSEGEKAVEMLHSLQYHTPTTHTHAHKTNKQE